ncbi:hypothetical protein DNTS_000611, partial [Danionella cerebrum]
MSTQGKEGNESYYKKFCADMSLDPVEKTQQPLVSTRGMLAAPCVLRRSAQIFVSSFTGSLTLTPWYSLDVGTPDSAAEKRKWCVDILSEVEVPVSGRLNKSVREKSDRTPAFTYIY